jgi:hypothetical protein
VEEVWQVVGPTLKLEHFKTCIHYYCAEYTEASVQGNDIAQCVVCMKFKSLHEPACTLSVLGHELSSSFGAC